MLLFGDPPARRRAAEQRPAAIRLDLWASSSGTRAPAGASSTEGGPVETETLEQRRARWEAYDEAQAASRIDELVRELGRHNYLYHVLDKAEISDREYDLLYRELESLEGRWPSLRRVDSTALDSLARLWDRLPEDSVGIATVALDSLPKDWKAAQVRVRLEAMHVHRIGEDVDALRRHAPIRHQMFLCRFRNANDAVRGGQVLTQQRLRPEA